MLEFRLKDQFEAFLWIFRYIIKIKCCLHDIIDMKDHLNKHLLVVVSTPKAGFF